MLRMRDSDAVVSSSREPNHHHATWKGCPRRYGIDEQAHNARAGGRIKQPADLGIAALDNAVRFNQLLKHCFIV